MQIAYTLCDESFPAIFPMKMGKSNWIYYAQKILVRSWDNAIV